MVELLGEIGFLRQKVSDDQLVASTCVFCHRVVGATRNLELLSFIEKIHCCSEKRHSGAYGGDGQG
jgi:hypothetical protein